MTTKKKIETGVTSRVVTKPKKGDKKVALKRYTAEHSVIDQRLMEYNNMLRREMSQNKGDVIQNAEHYLERIKSVIAPVKIADLLIDGKIDYVHEDASHSGFSLHTTEDGYKVLCMHPHQWNYIDLEKVIEQLNDEPETETEDAE